MLQKLLTIIIFVSSFSIAHHQKTLVIAWINFFVSFSFTVRQIHLNREKSYEVVIKHLKEFLLTVLYMIWVVNVCWVCERKKKGCSHAVNAVLSPVAENHFIYFLPIILNTFWKLYILIKNPQKEQLHLIEQSLELQSMSEIFIMFYFLLQQFFQLFSCLVYHLYRFRLKYVIMGSARILLLMCYIGVKYQWSIKMRESFWKYHLFFDKMFFYIYLRRHYHKFCGFLIETRLFFQEINQKLFEGNKNIENRISTVEYTEPLGEYFDFI